MALLCPMITTSYVNTDVSNEPVLINIDCIEDLCRLWSIPDQECSIKMTEIILRHLHNAHEHELIHTCEEGFTATCGSITVGDIIPKASILVSEFVGNEDLDGNSEVYGKDFKIDVGDSNIPPMLKPLEDHPDNIATVTMTWNEYLLSVENL